MKKLFLLLIIILTGCAKYTDLKDLSIIKSIGIEFNNGYTIYAQIYDEIKKDDNPKTMVIKVHGNTIKESFNNFKKMVNKEIFLSHIDLLILDTNLKDVNYNEIIDYFIYNNELRNDFITILSSDIYNLLANTKYNEIEDYIKKDNTILNTSFEELANNYLENKIFYISKITYNDSFEYQNYYFNKHKLERLNNEEN